MERRYRVRPRLYVFAVLLVALLVLVIRGLGHGRKNAAPPSTPPPTTHHHRVTGPPTSAVAGSWHRATWSLSAPARGQAATVGDGDLLLVGGLNTTSHSTVQAYGPNRISVSLPVAVHDAGAVVTGGDLFVFGGGTAAPTNTVQAIPLSGGSVVSPAPLSEPLSDLTAVKVNGKVYLVGGYTGTVYSDKVFTWAAGQPLSVAAVLPAGLRYAAVTVDGTSIVVAGGLTTTGNSAAVYVVNTLTGSVSSWPPLPTPLAYASAAYYKGAVWVAGGQTGSGNGIPSDATYWYDASQHAWKTGPRLPVATTDGALAAFAGKLWYAGGQTATAVTAAVWVLP